MQSIFLGAIFVITSVFSAHAQVTDAPQVGGTGGGGFDNTCRSGDVMIGYNAIIGKSLVTFAAVCQAETNGVLVGPNYGLRTFGRNDGPGPGGTPHVMVTPRCPGGTALSGMHIWVNKFNELDSVSGNCSPLLSNSVKGATIQRTGTEGGEAFSDDNSNCPKGMIAVGITIRSGALVDALGLKCSPFPWHHP